MGLAAHTFVLASSNRFLDSLDVRTTLPPSRQSRSFTSLIDSARNGFDAVFSRHRNNARTQMIARRSSFAPNIGAKDCSSV